uniref:KIB1-4 beta-propeller domain-containing protein n=1 Tax=Oryza punctata TaxID=4537 RepID=A0A0E0K202_ORYPU
MEEADDASAALDPKLAPLLLFGHGDATFLYSVPKRALLPRRVGVDDMMRGHRWWTTAQGWLLMAHRGSPCTFLWDPFTGRRVGLPPDHDGTILAAEGSHRRRCLLSCCGPMDPTSCVVLVIDRDDTVLWYCHPGDQRWVKKHQHQYLQHHEHRTIVIWALRKLTAMDGEFYTDDIVDDAVAVLEFSPEPVFTQTDVDDDDRMPPVYVTRTNYFVESNGELHSVLFSHPIRCDRIVARVGVYRLCMATTQEQRSAWVKVDSLGGRVFFVQIGSFGASLDAQTTGLRGNCIYYSGFNGKVLCVYDMERGTTAVIDPGTHLPYHQSPQVLMPTR